MILPNWLIRVIVLALFVPLLIWAALDGAWRCITEDFLPHVREALRNPEETRWGRKRT